MNTALQRIRNGSLAQWSIRVLAALTVVIVVFLAQAVWAYTADRDQIEHNTKQVRTNTDVIHRTTFLLEQHEKQIAKQVGANGRPNAMSRENLLFLGIAAAMSYMLMSC